MTPDIATHLQPYGGASFRDALRSTFEDERFNRVTILSAWILKSGVTEIVSPAQAFRARGGRITAIAGLSLKSATSDGLVAMLEHFDDAFVVYDNGGRTFHPKVMLAQGEGAHRLFVGSQNMTLRGLAHNFEAGMQATWLEMESPEPISAVNEYVRALLADSAVCKPLTYEFLEKLLKDETIGLRDEQGGFAGTGNDHHPRVSVNFGESSAPRPLGAQPGTSRLSATDTPTVAATWSKANLPRSDAQRPIRTHPLGHVALTRSRNPIDSGTYFRHVLFADANWLPSGPDRETALVQFEVVGIDGAPEFVTLAIDHTPKWESSQGNRATSMRWGEILNPLVRAQVDLTGRTLELQRLSDGAFKLIVHSRLASK